MGWIKKILLAFFVLAIIGAILGNDTKNETPDTSQNQNVNSNTNVGTTTQKEYVSVSLDNLILDFVSKTSPLTDLQKTEKFKNYDNKFIKDSAIVKEIDTVALSNSIVVRTINPENEFLNGATIYFKSSEKTKLLNLSKYDDVKFDGKIEDYNSLLGIVIMDASIIN